jgi:transposase InsO family protein
MSYSMGAMITKNSIFCLYDAITKHEVVPYCLNSDRGTQFFPNKKNKDGKASHAFQKELEELGISFIPSKARHPQTNGKNEKFFDIFEKEFDERFETIDDFFKYYNQVRLSEAINYMTPNEAYNKRL